MIYQPNFCLLDASRMDEAIYKAKELNADFHCLYEGESARFLNSVAPFLFSFEKDTPFSQWFFEEGNGKSWGILFIAPSDLLDIYRHLRKFLIILSDDDRELYFRYYDPRVLGVFLPTCTSDQLTEFFGPISTFISENDEGKFTAYTHEQGILSVDENVEIFNTRFVQNNNTEQLMQNETNKGSQKENGGKSKWDFY